MYLVVSFWQHSLDRPVFRTMEKSKEGSENLRRRIVDVHKSGKSLEVISKELQIPGSSVQTIVRRHRLFKSVTTLSNSGWRAKSSSSHERNLVRVFRNNLGTKCSGLPWTRNCQKDPFHLTMGWEDADQESSHFSKITTFKLDWNLELPTWTNQMPFGKKFYSQTRQRLSRLVTIIRGMFGGLRWGFQTYKHCTYYQVS